MSKSKSGKSGFALMAEEELLQEEALGMGLAFQLEDDQGSEDEVGVPQDGMQYLKQVVKEAKKLDAVFKGKTH